MAKANWSSAVMKVLSPNRCPPGELDYDVNDDHSSWGMDLGLPSSGDSKLFI